MESPARSPKEAPPLWTHRLRAVALKNPFFRLRAGKDNLLCGAGGEIPAHEFHHWDAEEPGRDFTASKASGKSWSCVHATDRLYGGFPHFHFYGNPDFAVRFYDACVKEKHRYD